MAYSKVITKELALNGKLITNADPATIGTTDINKEKMIRHKQEMIM